MKLVQTTESLRRDFTPDGDPTTVITASTFEIRDDNGNAVGNASIHEYGVSIQLNGGEGVEANVALVRKMFANITEE